LNQIFLGEFNVGLKEQHKSTHNEIWTQDINSVFFSFKLSKGDEMIDNTTLLIVLPNETKVILQGVYDTEKEMYVTEHFDASVITNRAKQRAFGYLYGEAEDGTKGYDIGSFSFFVGMSAIDEPLEEAEGVYVPRFEELYEELKNLGIEDAPNDSKTYGRKNGEWQEVVGSIGVTEERVKEIAEEVVEASVKTQSGRVFLFGHYPEGLRGVINFSKEFEEIPVVAPVYQGDGSVGVLPIVQAYGVTTTGFDFLVQDASGINNYNAFMNWVAIGK
jgi:H-type lectin domain.